MRYLPAMKGAGEEEGRKEDGEESVRGTHYFSAVYTECRQRRDASMMLVYTQRESYLSYNMIYC